jgi:hypothetical protein
MKCVTRSIRKAQSYGPLCWVAAAALVGAALVACGGDSGGGSSEAPPATGEESIKTPAGAPTGAPVKATLTAAGGTVTSADGSFTVTFPAGALSEPTEIGVQEIENTAPNGVGRSYRLEPSGRQWPVPPKITWTLEAESFPRWIGTQRADGSWTVVDAEVDRATHTVSAFVPHFSNWGPILLVKITPKSVALTPGSSARFKFVALQDKITLVPPPGPDIVLLRNAPVDVGALEFSVNGIKRGNTTFGTIGEIAGDETNAVNFRYTAPATTPTPREFLLEVKLTVTDSKGRLFVETARATIRIQVGWIGTFHSKSVGPAGSIELTATNIEFVLKPGQAEPADGNSWILEPTAGGNVAYSETVGGCYVDAKPADHAVAPGNAHLQFVPDTSKPGYYHIVGAGATSWQASGGYQCPGGFVPVPTLAAGGAWFPLPMGLTNGSGPDSWPSYKPDADGSFSYTYQSDPLTTVEVTLKPKLQ